MANFDLAGFCFLEKFIFFVLYHEKDRGVDRAIYCITESSNVFFEQKDG